ncbi:MAG: hypothetical protein ABIC82_05025 [bacterium]
MKNKKLFLIPALAVALVVSGCGKKETSSLVVNNNANVGLVNENTNANLNQNTNSNVDENQGAGAVEDGQSGEEIDTSDWLVYRNEEYGFEVKYPGEWAVEEKNSSYNNDGVIGVFINLNQLEGFYIFPRGEFDYGLGNKIGSANLIIDGRDAIRDIYNNLYLIKFTDKNIYKDFRIELHYKDEKNLEKLNMILSTFKFIQENGTGEKNIDISNWQTYRNEEYGFEFKHPTDWKVYGENLTSFIPNHYASIDEDEIFEIGFFENKDNLEIEEWVDQNDFFNTKQYEDPNAFVAHGVDKPTEMISMGGINFKLYYGGGSGGISFGTGITKIDNELIIFAYHVVSYKVREEKEKVFKDIIKSFRI